MSIAPASPARTGAFRRALLDHYDACRRDLPWRGETDPYRILLSEVMLQQTRVETVQRYYGSWLERFPDLESLASADQDEVLEAWAGLGYYRRARNLHRAAKVVRGRPGPMLPSTYAGLLALPGVGEYTAGAVASIAFGESVPAVDGNVRRVLARLFDEADPRPVWLRGAAAELLDTDRPGDWNQALMELGATVCRPGRPDCGRCPVSDWCAARAAGTQDERPARGSPTRVRRATYVLAVLHADGRVLLVRRPLGGLLGGMWAFPEREVTGRRGATVAAKALVAELGLGTRGSPAALAPCEHRFTHLDATYLPFTLSADGEPDEVDHDRDRAWVEARDPNGVALPAAQRRVLASFVASRCELTEHQPARRHSSEPIRKKSVPAAPSSV